MLFFRLLAMAGAVYTSLFTLLFPVSAIGLGGVFLGEWLSGLQFGGMLLIGTGLLAINGRVLTLTTHSNAGTRPRPSAPLIYDRAVVFRD